MAIDKAQLKARLQTNPSDSLWDGLLCAYFFDAVSGTTIQDYSGNGNDLELLINGSGSYTWENGGLTIHSPNNGDCGAYRKDISFDGINSDLGFTILQSGKTPNAANYYPWSICFARWNGSAYDNVFSDLLYDSSGAAGTWKGSTFRTGPDLQVVNSDVATSTDFWMLCRRTGNPSSFSKVIYSKNVEGFSATSGTVSVNGYTAALRDSSLNVLTFASSKFPRHGSGVPIILGYGQDGFADMVLIWERNIIILPPATVTASDGTYDDKVNITWDAVDDAFSYEIYRSDDDDSGNAVLIGTSSSETYDDITVVADQVYYYFVKAVGLAETSDLSDSDSGYAHIEEDPYDPIPTIARMMAERNNKIIGGKQTVY